MRRSRLFTVLCCGLSLGLAAAAGAAQPRAQKKAGPAPSKETTAEPAKDPSEPKAAVTQHTLAINGRTIRYTATAATIELKDDKGEATASMFYVAYTEDGVADPKTRPITFAYNGGPGSSTIWLHMGAFGPMRVLTSDAQPTPPPPYDLVSNGESLLDKTDLVFIDAVGTGYSTILGKATGKDFWGVDEDVRTFGQFIERYLSRNNRWNSPKFLLGESYGTTRSANLVDYLADQGIACNGVILISSILNYGDTFPGTNLEYITYLPSYAAIAWYHNKLNPKPTDFSAFLQEVREFAETDYASALFEGSRLPAGQYSDVLAKLHQYTGLSTEYLKEANLRINPTRFRAQLLRDEDRTVGRYDARFEGINSDNAKEFPDYDASDTSISPAFTAAFQSYVRNDLKFDTDRPYKTTNYSIIRQWDWKHPIPGRGQFFTPPFPDVAANLAEAMRQNPHLKIFSANGWFDLATPFFKTEFDLGQMELDPSLRSNIVFGYYPSGHMIYLHYPALKQLKSDLSTFYNNVEEK